MISKKEWEKWEKENGILKLNENREDADLLYSINVTYNDIRKKMCFYYETFEQSVCIAEIDSIYQYNTVLQKVKNIHHNAQMKAIQLETVMNIKLKEYFQEDKIEVKHKQLFVNGEKIETFNFIPSYDEKNGIIQSSFYIQGKEYHEYSFSCSPSAMYHLIPKIKRMIVQDSIRKITAKYDRYSFLAFGDLFLCGKRFGTDFYSYSKEQFTLFHRSFNYSSFIDYEWVIDFSKWNLKQIENSFEQKMKEFRMQLLFSSKEKPNHSMKWEIGLKSDWCVKRNGEEVKKEEFEKIISERFENERPIRTIRAPFDQTHDLFAPIIKRLYQNGREVVIELHE